MEKIDTHDAIQLEGRILRSCGRYWLYTPMDSRPIEIPECLNNFHRVVKNQSERVIVYITRDACHEEKMHQKVRHRCFAKPKGEMKWHRILECFDSGDGGNSIRLACGGLFGSIRVDACDLKHQADFTKEDKCNLCEACLKAKD